MFNDDLKIKSQRKFIKAFKAEVNPITTREIQSIMTSNVADKTRSSHRTLAQPHKGDEHQVNSLKDEAGKPNTLHQRPHSPSNTTKAQSPPRFTTNTKGNRREDTIDNHNPTEEVESPTPALQIEAMKKAQRILSKYKNKSHLEANPQSDKSWLVHTINKIIHSPNKTMKQHKVKFHNSIKAAEWNAKLLK